MSDIPAQLQSIQDRVMKGENPTETVRTLLSWFGAYRRGWRTVAAIREALTSAKLETNPDFEGAYIDGLIGFVPQADTPEATISPTEPPPSEPDEPDNRPTRTVQPPVKAVDPTHRISRLASANTPPVSVKPDATLAEAVTIMLLRDFSQVPVMTSDREVKGIISWKLIGLRKALDRPCQFVREIMEQHAEVTSDASLFEVIRLIIQHECVLVRDATRKVTGIVTAADISEQFHQLSEPFLLLSEIENHIRSLIAPRFSIEELQAAKDPADAERQIEDVSDLTFGEYLRLLNHDARWEKLGTRIDRRTFVGDLDRVRAIRNDIMHFDPDGIGVDDLDTLRSFARFLDRLQRLATA